MKSISRGRSAAVAALVGAASVTGGLASPASLAAQGAEPPTPGPSAQADDWRTPSPSTTQPPAQVVGTVDGPVRLNVVRESDRGPLTQTLDLPDRDAALAAVDAAQDDPRLLAVETTNRVRLLADDPLRSSQWALNTLQAEQVWQTSTGSGVTVAVVDTGVAAAHPDLGTVESGGVVLVGADCTSGGSLCTGTGRSDVYGHGTHVSGIIAAQRNNDIGISGLAPGARILPVQVLSDDGWGYDSWVANGIRYAANNGADVVNLSLGGGYSDAISTAVDYARSQGVIVAAAAGNEGSGAPPSYPGALDTVMGVAATTSSDQVATFSTRGSYVDVAAPGQSVLSTVPPNVYESWSGTSMATPYVAAAVALMQEEKTSLTADEAASVLQSTATDLGTAGPDVASGYGRINPVQAVACVSTGCAGDPPPAEPVATTFSFQPRRPRARPVGTSTVRARLTMAPASDPVAGATTTLSVGTGGRTVSAVTDSTGYASFVVVDPGRGVSVRACFAGNDDLLPSCTSWQRLRR